MRANRKPASRKSQSRSVLNPRPGEWALIHIDGEPIRTKARKAYEKAMRDLETARAEARRFQEEDVPAFAKWLNSNFGSLLSEIREIQAKLQAAEELIGEVEHEFFYGDFSSYAEAYQYLLQKRAAEAEAAAFDETNKTKPDEKEGFDEDADDERNSAEDDFWEELGDAWNERSQAKQSERADRHALAGPRLKDLYRQLARRLHPDKLTKPSAKRMEWWHQTQEAYEMGDVEKLEMILTLVNVEERGTREATVSLLSQLTADFKKTLRSLKRQLTAFQKDPSWNFSRMANRNEISLKMRVSLERDRARLLLVLRHFELQVATWTAAAAPKRRTRSKRRVAPDEEFF